LRGFSQWFAPHRREAFTQCAKGRPGEMRSKMHVNNTTHTSKPRGQSLIEFALLLPVLLVLIISALEFGRLFYTKIVITNAAREGANYYAGNILKLEISDLKAQSREVARIEAENSGVMDINPLDPVEIVRKEPLGEVEISLYSVIMEVEATVEDLLILGIVGNAFSITTESRNFNLSSSVEMLILWK
jgi:hypothetical protein